MADQVWQIPVTPAQRWVLLNLAHDPGQKLEGQRGRVFRRFMRAFRLETIRDALHAHNKVAAEMVSSRTAVLFELTAENVDYALGLLDVKRAPADEMTMGPLWDLLEDAKSGKCPDVVPGAEPFNPADDNWAPRVAVNQDDLVPDKIAAGLEEAGHTDAAQWVRRGLWDKPAKVDESA